MKGVINAYMASPYGSAMADCTAVPDSTAFGYDWAWAMVWQVEGFSRYRDCAIKMSEQAMAYFCPGGGAGNAACYSDGNNYREFLNHAAVVFDWAYSGLSSGDKTLYIDNLTHTQTYSAVSWQINNQLICWRQ